MVPQNVFNFFFPGGFWRKVFLILVICLSVLNSINVSCLAGAPLKVCPQGFSCCTVEMEEKLSQQSHTEIKAPVSRLSTNLQSTFRQRHSHFDSKHTRSAQADALRTASKWLWRRTHVLRDLWWTFPPAVALPEAETLRLCLWACPPVPHCLSSHTAWSSATCSRPPSRETRMLVNRPHTSSNLVFSLLPVPLCEPLINIEIGFPREHMGTHSSAESPKKVGQLWIPSATQRCHHCLFCWDKLDKIRRTAYNGPR